MVKYAEDTYRVIESRPSPCRPYGQGSDGYGRKIAMPYQVRFDRKGPWRRVYCCQISNAGTIYVLVEKDWVCLRRDEDVRLNGEWPKG